LQNTGLPAGNKKRKNNKKASTTSSQSADNMSPGMANDEAIGVNSTSTGSYLDLNAANNALLTSGGKSELLLTQNNIAANSEPGSKLEPTNNVSALANQLGNTSGILLGAAGAGALSNTGNVQIGVGGVPSGSVGVAGSVSLGTSAVLSGSAGAAQIGAAGVTDREN
jgi:hypothetical protein